MEGRLPADVVQLGLRALLMGNESLGATKKKWAGGQSTPPSRFLSHGILGVPRLKKVTMPGSPPVVALLSPQNALAVRRALSVPYGRGAGAPRPAPVSLGSEQVRHSEGAVWENMGGNVCCGTKQWGRPNSTVTPDRRCLIPWGREGLYLVGVGPGGIGTADLGYSG